MDQAAFLKGIAAAEAAQANELQRPAQWCAWCGNKSDGCSPIRVDDLLSSFHRATGVHRFIEPALKQLAAKKQKHGVKDSDQITYRQLAKLALPPGLSKFGLPVLQDATFLQTEAAICGDCSATACAADQPLGGTQIFNRVCGNLDHPAPLPAPLLLPDPVPEPEDYLEIAQRAQYEQSASAARFSKVPNHLRSMYFRGQPQPKHYDHYAGSFQMTRGIQVQPRLPGMQDTYGEIMSGTQLLTIKRRTQPKIGAEDAKFLKKRNAAYKQQSPMMKMVESFSPLRMQKDQNHITAGFTDGLLQQVNGVEYTVPVAKVAPLSFDSQLPSNQTFATFSKDLQLSKMRHYMPGQRATAGLPMGAGAHRNFGGYGASKSFAGPSFAQMRAAQSKSTFTADVQRRVPHRIRAMQPDPCYATV